MSPLEPCAWHTSGVPSPRSSEVQNSSQDSQKNNAEFLYIIETGLDLGVGVTDLSFQATLAWINQGADQGLSVSDPGLRIPNAAFSELPKALFVNSSPRSHT